jgi:hypothetical protein
MFITRRKKKICYVPQIVTQTIEIPGPTVEVPGPTEYVNVNVPGPTVYVTDGLLAKIDFTNIPAVDLKTDGDYPIAIASGSTTATTATLKAFKCAGNIGAAGIQRINGGFLELNSDTVTSELGLEYWSNKPVPMLGIDLRTISSKLGADTAFQGLSYEVIAEIEPLWNNGVKIQLPVYTYLGIGFLSNLDTWAATGTPRPIGAVGGIRNLSQSPTTRNAEIFRIGFKSGGFTRGSFSQGSLNTSPAPFNTWHDTTTKKLSVTWEGLAGIVTHNNGSSSLKANAGGQAGVINSFVQPSTFVVGRGTNNLWLVVYASRSTSSMQGGDIPFRIKSLSIYERGL